MLDSDRCTFPRLQYDGESIVPSHQYIYISNLKVSLYLCDRNGIVALESYTQTQFKNAKLFLQQTRNVPCSLIVDIIEEDYKRDTIPHVHSYERQAVIQRKMKQLYRDTPYRHASLHGRETTGRRDDRLLISAIINPELVSYWLELLNELKIPVQGIHSIAFISYILSKKLKIKDDKFLLVTLQYNSGIRISFYDNEQLQLSRLTLNTNWEHDQTLKLLIKEIDKTQMYINRLRLLTPGQKLKIIYIGNADYLEELKLAVNSNDLTEFGNIQHKIIAKTLGLANLRHDFLDEIIVQFLHKCSIPKQYAVVSVKNYQRHYLGTIALKVFVTAASLAMIFFSIQFWLAQKEFIKNNAAVERNLTVFRSEIDALKKQIPAQNFDSMQTKSVV